MSGLVDKLVSGIIYVGVPLTQAYHFLCGSIFFNMVDEEARGIEKVANYVLAPTHYLFCGTRAKEKGVEDFSPRFQYDRHFLVKTAASFVVLPLSAGAGMLLKASAFLMPETRKHHHQILDRVKLIAVHTNHAYYRSLGIRPGDFKNAKQIETLRAVRRPGEEENMKKDKEALREIIQILHAHNIPCWVDCGTLLGTFRYGGVIPWDWDLDLAVLAPDFDNVKSALNALDPKKYDVQDWSGRDLPKTYLKVYVKETHVLIDIYHFAIDPETKTLRSIFSNAGSPFLPESMKIRERRYCVSTPFDLVFPLRKGNFDGLEVPVPAKTKEYLQLRYGENLAPAKIYNAKTERYENDPLHPYWKMAHAR